MRWLIPILQQSLQSNGIDITDYYDLILSYFFLLMCPMVYGMIVGFTLLDERDEMTLFAIQVSPLNMRTYLLYKLVVPVILSFISILIVLPLSGLPYPDLNTLILINIQTTLLSIMMALILVIYASNKVEGFVIMKGSGILFLMPTVAYFVDEPWQWLFGIFPTYWPVKSFWLWYHNDSYLHYYLIGWLILFISLYYLLKRFTKKIIIM